MSFTNFDVALTRQYESNVLMEAQQNQSKLLGAVVKSTDVQGEMVFFNQYGRTSMTERTSRLADLTVTDTSYNRRAAVIRDYEVTEAIDVFDIAKTNIGDPLNPVAMAQAAALGRKIDELVISSAFAVALGGKAGTVSNTFPAANQIAVDDWDVFGGSGNAGLTVAKIVKAKRLLDNTSVPKDNRFIICTPQQISDLLATVQVGSADYNSVRALQMGEVQKYAGFNFVEVEPELLPVDGSGHARVIAMHGEGIGFGMSMELTRANIFNDMKKGGAPTVFTLLGAGAVRRDDKRVIEIKCAV